LLKRRQFIPLSGAALAWPLIASAQQAAKTPRKGYLVTNLRANGHLYKPFLQRLRELGYVDGQNLLIEYRDAEGQLDRLPALAAELADLDVIISSSSLGLRAVQQAISTVPIVCPLLGDPVGDGFAASLAQPGGNITGLTTFGLGLVPKRLELLKELVPNASRVAVLRHPGNFSVRSAGLLLKEIEDAAQSLGLQVSIRDVWNLEELNDVFSAIASEHTDALINTPGSLFFQHRRRLIDLVAKHRLPAMYDTREHAESGGLMAYGPKLPDLNRRSADYVVKILKGAKAGDLPTEQPTEFELLINLRTAKALGLTIPQSVLLPVDEVIE
jgi:putative ABC transport system substrate-binding protein